MPPTNLTKDWREIAQAVLQVEAQALAAVADRLDHNLAEAVELLLRPAGKVVVSGIGKSGHIGPRGQLQGRHPADGRSPPSQISVPPVVDLRSRRCQGLIRVHDIYQPELI